MKQATSEQVKQYWLDACPVCGGKVVLACKCMISERQCAKGHRWRRNDDGNAVIGGHSHGKKE